jgi:hypothetical protein
MKKYKKASAECGMNLKGKCCIGCILYSLIFTFNFSSLKYVNYVSKNMHNISHS